MLNNIALFNDGQSPGYVVADPEVENVNVALYIHNEFMTRPEFKLSDASVQNAFKELVASYKMQLMVPQNMMMMPAGMEPPPPDVLLGQAEMSMKSPAGDIQTLRRTRSSGGGGQGGGQKSQPQPA
jgi:hypothetical protein